MKMRGKKFDKVTVVALLGALLFIFCAGCANLGQAPASSSDQLSAALSGLSVLKPELAPKIATVQKALKATKAAEAPAVPEGFVLTVTPRFKGEACDFSDWSVEYTMKKLVTGEAAFTAAPATNPASADGDEALAGSLADLLEALQKDAAAKAPE